MHRFQGFILVLGTLAAIQSGQVRADGVAVFASLTEEASVAAVQTKLHALLDVDVEISRLDISGTRWIRLHSRVMPESAARELTATAVRNGYSAWFNGSGDSLVTSSSAVAALLPAPTGALVDRPIEIRKGGLDDASPAYSSDVERFGEDAIDRGFVTPAEGDVSHLPLAETFSID